VVEFDGIGFPYSKRKGVAGMIGFHKSRKELCLWSCLGNEYPLDNIQCLDLKNYSIVKKVDSTTVPNYSIVKKVDSTTVPIMEGNASRDIAKAYFAKTPQVTPQESSEAAYKVGDLVEHFIMGEWVTAKVIKDYGTKTDQRYEVVLQNGRERVPYARNIRPLSGTYAERQAKWIEFWDLKVGDKVKVVRKAKSYEDGWANSWCSDTMDEFVGCVKPIYVAASDSGIPLLRGQYASYRFPYFALEPVKQRVS
jgi:hypothetical protein